MKAPSNVTIVRKNNRYMYPNDRKKRSKDIMLVYLNLDRYSEATKQMARMLDRRRRSLVAPSRVLLFKLHLGGKNYYDLPTNTEYTKAELEAEISGVVRILDNYEGLMAIPSAGIIPLVKAISNYI